MAEWQFPGLSSEVTETGLLLLTFALSMAVAVVYLYLSYRQQQIARYVANPCEAHLASYASDQHWGRSVLASGIAVVCIAVWLVPSLEDYRPYMFWSALLVSHLLSGVRRLRWLAGTHHPSRNG